MLQKQAYCDIPLHTNNLKIQKPGKVTKISKQRCQGDLSGAMKIISEAQKQDLTDKYLGE